MMYVRSSGNRPATTTPRPVFASSLGRLRRRRWPLLGCWRPPPFDDELLERREEEEEEKETEAREVRKRGRCCCCCFQGVVWARVAVVVIISLYILFILRKKEFVLVVSFFGVFLVNFFWREIFFSLFFILFSSKTQQTRSILDGHTLQNNARPKLCVCLRVSVVWLSFKRNNLTHN